MKILEAAREHVRPKRPPYSYTQLQSSTRELIRTLKVTEVNIKLPFFPRLLSLLNEVTKAFFIGEQVNSFLIALSFGVLCSSLTTRTDTGCEIEWTNASTFFEFFRCNFELHKTTDNGKAYPTAQHDHTCRKETVLFRA